MNITVRKPSFFIAAILCLVLNVGWSSDDGEDDLVLQEYYRLLNLANDGDSSDKVALFIYAAEHSGELEKYAETALGHLVEASNSGDGEASALIGYISEKGFWMEQSDEGAMIFYVLAAQQGSAKGMAASVTYFGKVAIAADPGSERESALVNAQKWYDALEAIREESPRTFETARFNHAATRLKINSMDEYGMTLLSEAAIDGHETAATLIRGFHAEASSADFAGDKDAARIVELWNSTIQVIGTGETRAE